jgi:hypothetical protein
MRGRQPTLLGPLGRANLNHWTNSVSKTTVSWLVISKEPNGEGGSSFTQEWKQIQFPKCVLLLLDYQTMAKVQKPSNCECYKPSSEPFRTNFKSVLQKFEMHR